MVAERFGSMTRSRRLFAATHGGLAMPMREKDRKLRRRQRRVIKIRKLKAQLAETTDVKVRARLIEKIRRIDPWAELPE